jgi:glyoxylase-like metal-dependent hydrolase (beta-lactamase superfamily II)
MSVEYEVYAIKYGRTDRPTREFFIYPDPHDGPRPIFYYIWVLKGPDGAIVVDTGFTHERAALRNRKLDRLPTEGLSALGVRAEDVKLVILTHLHYDHAGNIDKFPNAEFVVQDEEVRFATGRYIKYKPVQLPFEADDVVALVRKNFKGRVRFVDGDAEVAPGVRVHLVPDHAKGLQAVTVPTRRGTLVLASDAAHFFENVTAQNPHPIIVDLPRTVESYERLVAMAPSPDHFIPGHDPAVMDLYPKLDGDPLTVVLSADPLGPSPLASA